MRAIYCLLFHFLLFQVVSAQTITGKIVDNFNGPVAGASVTLKNTFTGTVSDKEGRFQLNISRIPFPVLVIGAIGYEPIEKEVLNDSLNTELSIVLNKSISSLKEVTVTASRRPEVVDRTPASVQVINAKEIEAQSMVAPSFSSILGYTVPSLGMGSNGTSNTGQTLRGRTPLILIDGIPQSTPLRNGARDIRTIDPSVIQRVEVIKGATAIYGNGADGGLINYITLQPNSAKKINATTSIAKTGMAVHAAETDGFRLGQQLHGRLGKLDYAVSGLYEKTGVFKDANGVVITPVNSYGETALMNVFSKAGYNLNDKNRVEVMYNYFSSKQNSEYIEQAGKHNVSPSIGVKGEVKSIDEGTRYNHNAYAKYQAKGLFLNSSLEASAYMQKFYTVYGYSIYFVPAVQSSIHSDKKGLRLQLNTPWKIGRQVENEILYGIDYLNDKTWQDLTDGRIWVPKMNLKNAAPFVQFSSTINRYWMFKAGYRLDQVSLTIPSFTQVRTSQNVGGKTINGGDLSFSASTFNTGLRYTKWEAFKPFASFTQGFSMVDVGLYVRGAKEDDIAKMQLQPIIVNNYELGFSSSFKKVSLTGSAYASTSKIGANIVEQNGFYVQQRAPERILGIEGSLEVAAVKNLLFGTGVSYMEGKVDINKNGKYDDPEDVYLTGRRIIPLKIVSHIKFLPNSRSFVNLEWVYSGNRERFQPQANGKYKFGEGPVHSYGVVNLNGAYNLTEKIRLFAGIENLLNKDYYNTTSQWYATDAYYIKSNGIRYQAGVSYKW